MVIHIIHRVFNSPQTGIRGLGKKRIFIYIKPKEPEISLFFSQVFSRQGSGEKKHLTGCAGPQTAACHSALAL